MYTRHKKVLSNFHLFAILYVIGLKTAKNLDLRRRGDGLRRLFDEMLRLLGDDLLLRLSDLLLDLDRLKDNEYHV